MSKIYEALNREHGAMADVILPSLGEDEPIPGPVAAPVSAEAKIPAAESAPFISAPANSIPSAAAGVPPFESEPATYDGIRTVSLRVPSSSPLLPFEEADEAAGDQYKIIRTKIIQHPRQPRVIMVASAGPGDGKTVTSINLAAALSLKSEASVLLVDGDLRRSAIHTGLDLPQEPGLADVLLGACSLDAALVRAEQLPHLYILPAGRKRSNPSELLDSSQWHALCTELRRRFRYVVFDSSPIAAVADYDLIQAACDGVIVVLRPDHTNRTVCLNAIENVPKDKFIGVVLNCVPKWFLGKSASPYYYFGGTYNYRSH